MCIRIRENFLKSRVAAIQRGIQKSERILPKTPKKFYKFRNLSGRKIAVTIENGEWVDCKSNFQFARFTSGYGKVLQD